MNIVNDKCIFMGGNFRLSALSFAPHIVIVGTHNYASRRYRNDYQYEGQKDTAAIRAAIL